MGVFEGGSWMSRRLVGSVSLKQALEMFSKAQFLAISSVLLCLSTLATVTLPHLTGGSPVASSCNQDPQTTHLKKGKSPTILGPPDCPFSHTFLGEGSPTKTDRKSWYPYSHLSTGGPSAGAANPILKGSLRVQAVADLGIRGSL